MSYSNSSLNCFMDCMKKWEHRYVLHTEPCKPPSPHLTFGSMAHEVLEKNGLLRDEVNDGVVDKEKLYDIIPSEALYPELKQEFNISSWNEYFIPVCREVARIETSLIADFEKEFGEKPTIEREYKLSVTPEQMRDVGVYVREPFVGVVDLLLYNAQAAYIVDYKFSASRKTQDDFDMNSQFPMYAMLINLTMDIPVHNIKYGYIDIPKVQFDKPTMLSNGTLSRNKGQNCSAEFYKKCVQAIHGDDEKYNCEPGGYYHDIYQELLLKRPAYLSMQWADESAVAHIFDDLCNTARMIEYVKMIGSPIPCKYDSYSCKNCEYLKACKPWLYLGGE